MNKKAIFFIIALIIIVAAVLFWQKNDTATDYNSFTNNQEATNDEPELARDDKSSSVQIEDENEPELDDNKTPTPGAVADNAEPELTKSYTLAEVSQHASADDCWLAIGSKVYDVTPFISAGKHPGGEAILQGCGKDATELYETRPMGSGTPHSDDARELLSNYFIGKLQ